MPRRTALAGLQPRPDTHPGLWLDAYLRDDKAGQKAQTMREAVEGKRPPDDYARHFERIKASFANTHVRTLTAQTQGRLVIGLGNKNVLEMGIRLDRTWGVPVLPGSALKGLASHVAHLDAGGGWRLPDDKKNVAVGEHHAYLFGTSKNAGIVTFHDAWWDPSTEGTPLELDVMTVHHPDYYQKGNVPPSDMDSPNPVSFVTAQGNFLVALELAPGADPSWLDTALELLDHGLRNYGLGAKTNAGYGRMIFVGFQTTAQRDAEVAAKHQAELEADIAKRQAEFEANIAKRQADLDARGRDAQTVTKTNAQTVIGLLASSSTLSVDEKAELASVIAQKLGAPFLKDKADKVHIRQLVALRDKLP